MLVIPKVNMLASCVVVIIFVVLIRAWHNFQALLVLTQSISQLATGWTVQGSNPSGGKIFCFEPESAEAHPASCTVGTKSFPGVKQPEAWC
jgi:hypothetical protein